MSLSPFKEGTPPFVHPLALCESEIVGAETRIWAFAHVMREARIGASCNIGGHTFIESGAIIGDRVTIKNGVMIWDGVTIEDDVFVGPGVIFTNDDHPRSPRSPEAAARYQAGEWLRPTLIQRGASLGAGAVILPARTVGPHAMVGAGSVVTADIPAHGLYLGNPARHVGWVCHCGMKLNNTFTCHECGRVHHWEHGRLICPAA